MEITLQLSHAHNCDFGVPSTMVRIIQRVEK